MQSNREDDNVLKQLSFFIRSRKIPNIIFHGSPGCGKRTIVCNFINQIYENNKARIKSNIMFVNCAHGKGIRFIRDELKYFAKANMQCNENSMFKSIVLMNADELTIDAQSALRRCIELFSHNTRFFIIVENKYKLLNPILSRFCEIYIPDKISLTPDKLMLTPDNKPTNTNQITYTSLYKSSLEDTYHLSDYNRERIASAFTDLIPILEFDKIPPNYNHKYFMNYANSLYENGISCADLILFLEYYSKSSQHIKTCISLKFCYNKIKSEYRNEKMALFYLFDYLFLRSNKSLENISFI